MPGQAYTESVKASKRRYVERNAEKVAETKRRYARENGERVKQAQRECRARYPEKYRARGILYRALQNGQIAKPDRCEDCDKTSRDPGLHGHHADYLKPLEVEWLCSSCHGKRHRS